jgi:hypothetical protein
MISTVIVDKLEDYTSVLLDDNGFYPQIVNVEQVGSFYTHFINLNKIFSILFQNKGVLFDWRDTNQLHNIVHTTVPCERVFILLILFKLKLILEHSHA